MNRRLAENIEFRNPESLSDDEDMIHPNIDTRSYRRFVKEQRRVRYQELVGKQTLSEEESKELRVLEYKLLPVVKEISENSFRTSKESGETAEYSEELTWLVNNNSVGEYVACMDKWGVGVEDFMNFVYLSLAEAIKEGNDECGVRLCKIGLLAKWSSLYGRGYLVKISGRDEELAPGIEEHYRSSKEAILALQAQAVPDYDSQ